MEEHMEMLNNATADDLEKIPGIGRQNAENIVKFREKNGHFKSWDDLKKVPGMSEEVVNMMKKGEDWM